MNWDYHTHSQYSFDGECPAAEMVAAAARWGVTELCFTDHVDFDLPLPHVPDFAARREELTALAARFPAVAIRHGAEVSLKDAPCAAAAWQTIQGAGLDFILGSVHTIDGVDVWADGYYQGKAQKDAYRLYLERVAQVLPTFPQMHVLAHYDFVAKYAPYPHRAVTLDAAPDAFDAIFRYLIQNGKALEVNTASWQQDPPWGLDVLRRYRALGGEYVTLGSDTHGAERVGARIGEALDLVRAAGIPYIARFAQGQAQLVRV